jgi:uncharacterized phage protein (TIGR01671 family)
MTMREIKFRAFNDGKMLTMPLDTNFGISRFFGILRDDAIVMQYTGLKDKEGREIYEGDILEHLTDENVTRKKVVYDAQHGAFIMKCEKYFSELTATYGDVDMYADNYFIIGNIYENPELLTT